MLPFSLPCARQKTHFFREPVLPRLVISGLIINTGAIFSELLLNLVFMHLNQATT
ncbi:MAG: hypothetical protein KZQ66_16275 [Candidatus Thiodiazotropha sp. (ex Lucinoma aequizonata)]|nr:hypothetical protein [Candidatus Thiodiazotropha sp. (ex Lucinoma aequizonata)]MCU7900446.1 hypothetical protein [Candidatus Thiodiazotropha sp. (ex Lucinoma aequizonata)]MCU7903355.1 hypothetical protein [Candidatus Thiodiazotropha sp. (ex Lucinoma aequizonata)]